MRLPLKPVGLHSDEPSPAPSSDSPNESDSEAISSPDQGNIDAEGVDFDTAIEGAKTPTEEESEEVVNDFWSYMKAKMKAAMEWAHGIVQGLSGSDKPTTSEGDS